MYDILVVGAGPAGLTAAIYARRAGKTVLLCEKETFGGQITFSPHVENYPGHAAISGNELAANMLTQAMDLGAETAFTTVKSIARTGNCFTITTDDGTETAKTVILATGVKHRPLGVAGEEALIGGGISYCAVCDGAFFRGKTVAVVGGGDTALQDALYLAEGSAKVYLIHRRDGFRGEARLLARAEAHEKIEIVRSARVTALAANGGKLTGVTLTSTKDESTRALAVDGLFVAIGQIPENAPFAELAALDDAGYLASGEACTTQTPGLFVAGDCRAKTVRQLTTATADGAVAAIAACEYVDLMD